MIAAFALCAFLAASSAHAEYAERGKFALAPSGALDIGLYGYANPALASRAGCSRFPSADARAYRTDIRGASRSAAGAPVPAAAALPVAGIGWAGSPPPLCFLRRLPQPARPTRLAGARPPRSSDRGPCHQCFGPADQSGTRLEAAREAASNPRPKRTSAATCLRASASSRADRPRRPDRRPRNGHRARQRKNRAVSGRDRRTDRAPAPQAVFARAFAAAAVGPRRPAHPRAQLPAISSPAQWVAFVAGSRPPCTVRRKHL